MKSTITYGGKKIQVDIVSFALGLTLTFASSVPGEGGDVPVFVFAGQSNAVGVDTLHELRARSTGASAQCPVLRPE